MRQTFGAAIILAILLTAAFPAGADFKKTKIAVLDFQLHGERYETADMGKIVAEWLITALVKEGRFDVIERRLLEKVLSEQKLHASGLIDEQHVTKLGKMLGAKVVITGSLMKFQNVIEANARIIDVETGAVVAAEIVRSTSTAKLEDLVVQMADKIIRDFPLEGYVVKRSGNNVLLDLGKRNGVKRGMRFVVFKEGNIIKHPKTGEILDIERIETGSIEISGVNEKTSEAAIVSETEPESIEYGQQVKSFKEASALPPMTRIEAKPEKYKTEKTEKPRKARKGGGQTDVSGVDAAIENMKQLKNSGNNDWKRENKEILKSLKALVKKYKKSADVAFVHAKYYAAVDNISEAESYLKQALKYEANPVEVYVFQGDMYSEASSRKKGYAKDAVKSYLRAAESSKDKDLQTSLYLKIGDLYRQVLNDANKANDFWKKAAATDPESEAGRLASERLEGAKPRK